MNKAQHEVRKASLKAEKELVDELTKQYEKAQEQVKKRLYELANRTDMENIQTIIHQQKYQQMLLKNINQSLKGLKEHQYKSVDDYINNSYKLGYIGNMYDLMYQGIPITVPINPNKLKHAVYTDSKLSKPLWDSLSSGVDTMKKKVQQEITLGIIKGSSWADIAHRMESGITTTKMISGFNYAMRIARTEGHRVTETATYDAMVVAKEKGADVVKQWCSTLDDRTRPDHALLDGQIRDIDKPFEVNGHKGLYPGGFGVASEDIYCRCTTLQRAKWALDEDELKTLKQRADYFKLDKSDSFKEFSDKYLQLPKNADTVKLYEQMTMGSKVKNINKSELEKLINENFDIKDFESIYEKSLDKSVKEMVSSFEKIPPKKLKAQRKMREAIESFNVDKFDINKVIENKAMRKQFDYIDGENEILKIMKDCGVVEGKAKDFQDSIHWFTRNGYKEIRDVSNDSVKARYARNNIEEFIKTSSKYDGDIYRGMKFDSETGKQFISQIQVGSEMNMNGISSWSSSKDYAKQVSQNHNLDYQILISCKNKSGVGIQHLSTMPEECEVLQSASSKFMIKNIESKGTHYFIEVEEII